MKHIKTKKINILQFQACKKLNFGKGFFKELKIKMLPGTSCSLFSILLT